MGRIVPYIMENKKCSKPPTSKSIRHGGNIELSSIYLFWAYQEARGVLPLLRMTGMWRKESKKNNQKPYWLVVSPRYVDVDRNVSAGMPRRYSKVKKLWAAWHREQCDFHSYPGWWFGTFFIFHNIWNNPSHWLIFFKMVKTTNQYHLS